MVDSLPQERLRGTFHPTATFGRRVSLGPAIQAPAMKYDELIIFLSCHGMEDFPLYHTGEEAQGLLACYTALWHPALLASAGRLPIIHRPEDPPEALRKHRNPWLWGLFGMLTFLIAGIALACVSFLCPTCKESLTNKQWKDRNCPNCGDLRA